MFIRFVMALFVLASISARADDPKVLLIVLDGLRPDYVTPDVMPVLHALGERGIVFEDHHSVFPTVTRVNSSSITTGSYPASHGLMDNSVYFPEVDPLKGLNTSDAANLLRIDEATGGNLLTARSLPERLAKSRMAALVVSSGSSGSALLLNPKALGGGVINVERIFPETQRDRILGALGPAPIESTPNDAQNGWAVDAYLAFGLVESGPELAMMWLSDPDHTAHERGMGDPVTVDALRKVDAQVGRVLDAIANSPFAGKVDVIVTSDHGFSTHKGGMNVSAVLKDHGLDDGAVVVAGNVYVQQGGPERIAAIVKALQQAPWAGAIFTRGAAPDDMMGAVPGTLSLAAAHLDHPRAADIVVSANWSGEKNEFGFAGATTQGGVAGHGTSSPHDIRNTLIAAGPSFKQSVRSRVPSSNADLAPTICQIVNIEEWPPMYGRTLLEGLVEGPDPNLVTVIRSRIRSESEGYTVEMDISTVANRRYINGTRVSR